MQKYKNLRRKCNVCTKNYITGKITKQCSPAVDEHCSKAPAVLVTADRGDWGSAERRGTVLATARSSGQRRSGVAVAGAPGRPAAGAGEDRRAGGTRTALEVWKLASERLKS